MEQTLTVETDDKGLPCVDVPNHAFESFKNFLTGIGIIYSYYTVDSIHRVSFFRRDREKIERVIEAFKF